MKKCVQCRCRLGHDDLLTRESRRMESARASMGLDGLFFRYYTCPRCGHDHVFLEIVPLPGETGNDLNCRKMSLTRTVQDVHRFRTSILVVERSAC